jgi:hypothetical protein
MTEIERRYVRDRLRVIRLIEEAFSTATKPPDKIVENEYWPDSAELAQALAGRRWQDLSVDEIARFKEDLFLLTPEGFRFYVPAFMTRSIENPDEADLAMDCTLSSLSPPRRQASGRAWYGDDPTTAFAGFTQNERVALAEFVRFCAEWFPDLVSDDLLSFWPARA